MKKIVVVEDDGALRQVLFQCLEPLDCSIRTFKDGQEVFKFLYKNAPEVDLLIIDQKGKTSPKMPWRFPPSLR